ncbi:MAG: GNAT family N-acetyltransferase [Halofilum sp. (in: g-proteobacteria)]
MDQSTGRYRSVVTYLEMRSPTKLAEPVPPRPGVTAERWYDPDVDDYLELFHRVGDPWLWHGRLTASRDEIARLIRSDDYEVWRLWADGEVAGLGELDRSRPGEVKIEYFGLVPNRIGDGLGGFLLRTLLHEAARPGVDRIWLHTCTEDHPRAVDVYRHFGFQVYDEEVEWVHDPRLRGLLPRAAGPHVPIPE